MQQFTPLEIKLANAILQDAYYIEPMSGMCVHCGNEIEDLEVHDVNEHEDDCVIVTALAVLNGESI